MNIFNFFHTNYRFLRINCFIKNLKYKVITYLTKFLEFFRKILPTLIIYLFHNCLITNKYIFLNLCLKISLQIPSKICKLFEFDNSNNQL